MSDTPICWLDESGVWQTVCRDAEHVLLLLTFQPDGSLAVRPFTNKDGS